LSQIIGLYVHVPFCVRRCPYCAFYSLEGASRIRMEDYPRLILAELELRVQDWRGSLLGSIYLGGGTPSLLSSDAVRQIVSSIRIHFESVSDIEITLEANPGTLTQHSLAEYLQAGVNRLSLGIQALDDERLTFLGRIHTRKEALEALQLVRAAGFPEFSVDLMFGTPLETLASWDREFGELLTTRPDGISFYSLTVEEGTHLGSRAHRGERVALDQDETVDLMLHAAQILGQAGYRHYEVSNWALPGAECRHNIHYWQRGSYLGLGPSAHSFCGESRNWNLPDLKAYAEALNASKMPPSESELLSAEEIRSEWVYLQLRQDAGLDLAQYSELFADPPPYWRTMLESIAARGLGEFDGAQFRPNDKGLLLADELAARLLG